MAKAGKKIRATVARRPGWGCPLKNDRHPNHTKQTKPTQTKRPIRATAAKEVGMENPAEKRLSARIKFQNLHRSAAQW